MSFDSFREVVLVLSQRDKTFQPGTQRVLIRSEEIVVQLLSVGLLGVVLHTQPCISKLPLQFSNILYFPSRIKFYFACDGAAHRLQ